MLSNQTWSLVLYLLPVGTFPNNAALVLMELQNQNIEQRFLINVNKTKQTLVLVKQCIVLV